MPAKKNYEADSEAGQSRLSVATHGHAVWLKQGSVCVCPPHGVVDVIGIERHDMGGTTQIFYHLCARNNRMRILLPANKLHLLRPIASSSAVNRAFAVLRGKEQPICATTWAKRHKACLQKLKDGGVLQMAEVLRDLVATKITKGKELSVMEKQLLETTLELFVTEAAIASGESELMIEEKINSVLVRKAK